MSKVQKMLLGTACFALLFGMGSTAQAYTNVSDYRLPPGWWVQWAHPGPILLNCGGDGRCKKGTSLNFSDLCPKGPNEPCREMLKTKYDLELIDETANQGDTEASIYYTLSSVTDPKGSPSNPPPGTQGPSGPIFFRRTPGPSTEGSSDPAMSGTGPGGARNSVVTGGSYPGQEFVLGSLSGSQDGRDPNLINMLTNAHESLHMAYLALNSTSKDLNLAKLPNIGSRIIDPIAEQFDRLGGHTFDGSAVGLPQDVPATKKNCLSAKCGKDSPPAVPTR